MILLLLLAAWDPNTEVKGPFSHLAHINHGVDVRTCTTCHGVGTDWRATVAGRRDHQPCQNEACHAPLYRQKSQICLVCHVNNEPFKPNDLRHTRPTSAEWRMGVTPHAPHLARGVACLTCHPSVFGGPNTVEDGHKACGQCHEAANAKPTMAECKSCHQWFQEAKVATAPKRPWSTGARFVHDQRHYVDCNFCHRTPVNAPDLTPPTMEECARCHDNGGKAAKLKVTGFGCPKCHSTEKRRT